MAASPSDAAHGYQKAAQNGDPLAQWLLGRLYFPGLGMPRDLSEAQKSLTPGAQQNNPFAAHLLGRVLLERD